MEYYSNEELNILELEENKDKYVIFFMNGCIILGKLNYLNNDTISIDRDGDNISAFRDYILQWCFLDDKYIESWGKAKRFWKYNYYNDQIKQKEAEIEKLKEELKGIE